MLLGFYLGGQVLDKGLHRAFIGRYPLTTHEAFVPPSPQETGRAGLDAGELVVAVTIRAHHDIFSPSAQNQSSVTFLECL